MALVSLFIDKPTRAKIAQLDLDASLTETHSASATPTQNPIESDGGEVPTVTDNVVLNPLKLALEGVISQTPLGSSALVESLAVAGGSFASGLLGQRTLASAAALTGAASIGGLVSNQAGFDDIAVRDKDGQKSRKPSDVYNYLLELRDRRIPFDVVTALKFYENMILSNIDVPRNSQNRGMLRFTATLEQVTIVSMQEISLRGVSSIGGQAEETQKLGKQSGSAASEKAANDSTIAYDLFGPK